MGNPQEKIGLKSIENIFGSEFVIPEYQRGYRWARQNVADLLNDIYDFEPTGSNFYCLQPLVVRRMDEDILGHIKEKIQNNTLTVQEVQNMLKGKWEVIDGQQRLTTILLILSCLQNDAEMPYTITYAASRKESAKYLQDIWSGQDVSAQQNDKKDFYHIAEARDEIENWLKNDGEETRPGKRDRLTQNLGHVKFIWYEPVEGNSKRNSIEIFTRLNIGKIPLSDAELIKAIFLSRSNFGTGENATVRLRQQEIAQQWDEMENALQDPEFWSFISHEEFDQWGTPTRIDFILDLVAVMNLLGAGKEKGTEHGRTFRYFWKVYEQKHRAEKEKGDSATRECSFLACWEEVKRIFVMFREWFHDVQFYHYVGFLVTCASGTTVNFLCELIDLWRKQGMTKADFARELKKRVAGTLKESCDLDVTYGETARPLTACRSLLLLHNLQTIINQTVRARDQYDKNIFYKFPFHIYRQEHWDIEHIEPRTPASLDDPESRKDFLSNWYPFLSDPKLQNAINDYLRNDKGKEQITRDRDEEFMKIVAGLPKTSEPLGDTEKNQIMNFVLLDRNTNRSYKNAPFPAKRRTIIDKDMGQKTTHTRGGHVAAEKKIQTPAGQGSPKPESGPSAFVPPCTRHVFLKYYSPMMTSPHAWTMSDALHYKQDILNTLSEFNVVSNQLAARTTDGLR